MRLPALLLSALVLLPSTARAWDRDGHFAWTAYLALHAGFTERQALQIASAAQAVDAGPLTQPPEAVAWERIATDEGATSDPRLRALLRDLHCFSATPDGPPADSLTALGWVDGNAPAPTTARATRADALWEDALATGNPGVLIHYLQDCASHRGFGDLRGHAGAGHLPDWMATDLGRATEMTLRTLGALTRFREARGLPAPEPDVDRVLAVLEALTEADPVDRSGTIGPEGPANPLRWLEVELGETPLAQVFERRRALQLALAERFDLGRPTLMTAVDALDIAIREDKVMGRLPAFPAEWWSIPHTTWLPYALDAAARPLDGAHAWEIEAPSLTHDPAQVDVAIAAPARRSPDRLMRLTFTLPYRVAGVADLPPWRGLPVQVSCAFDDAPPVVRTADLADGAYSVERVLVRAARDLVGPITLGCEIWGHGLAPIKATATFEGLSDAARAAEVPEARVLPAALAPHLDALHALDAEAWSLAGQVATATAVSDALRADARAVTARVRDEASALAPRLAAAEVASQDVPTARRDGRRALVQATDARERARTAKGDLDAAHAAGCAQADALARSRDLDAIRAAWQTANEADARVATTHAALAAALDELAARVHDVTGLDDRLSALEAEGRHLKDAVWALEPALRGAERALDDAASHLRDVSEPAARLAALEQTSADHVAALRTAWETEGKPKEGKLALKDAAALHARITAASRAWGGAVASATSALTADRAQTREVGGIAADLGARVAALAERLPPPALLSDLSTLALEADDVAHTARRLGPEGALARDRARTCHHAAAAAYTAHVSPAGQVALRDCPETQSAIWDRKTQAAICQ